MLSIYISWNLLVAFSWYGYLIGDDKILILSPELTKFKKLYKADRAFNPQQLVACVRYLLQNVAQFFSWNLLVAFSWYGYLIGDDKILILSPELTKFKKLYKADRAFIPQQLVACVRYLLQKVAQFFSFNLLVAFSCYGYLIGDDKISLLSPELTMFKKFYRADHASIPQQLIICFRYQVWNTAQFF